MFDLSGRRALVTGATGGIGSAIARALHAQGAHVLLTGRRQEALEALAGELGERTGVMAAELADSAAAGNLIAQAEAEGGLDILVNNAGITRDNLAMRMKDEEWAAVIETNLTSAFRLVRASLRGMMKQRFGRIVNVTSVVGLAGNAGQANYAASKAGLVGFTKAVAREVASRSITVNALAPGFVETEMVESIPEKVRQRLLDQIPLKRFGKAEEVARAVIYLVSSDGDYITGEELSLNGGLLMR